MDGTKYYNANFVFDKQKEMEYILFDEGRIVNDNGNFMYEYHLKDHLGSVRVAFNPTTDGPNIVQENSYYPFGVPIADFSYNASENCYKHTGMEAIDDFGLNMLDNNARWRDVSAVPRFYGIDPLAEMYYSISPYAYCGNNPMKFIDPTGMFLTDYYNLKGNLVKRTEDGKTENKLILNFSNKERTTDKAIKKGEVVNVPSDAVVSTMEKAFKETESSGNEQYFAVGEQVKISKIVEGDAGTIKTSAALNEIGDTGENVAYDVHTHTYPAGKGNSPEAKASDTDLANIVGNQPNIVLGYDVRADKPPNQIGGASTVVVTRQIGFYNKQGRIGTPINFSTYKNAVNKINQ